ncbi:carboxypeptidase-like regulatory domain-containing protein [Mucilaginibacter sp.]|uniref:anti-sigma factor family protein n=1 Tax=Mucilaginibacter sp. TaxID=1882438 RepID=UPI0025F8E150|nr:carboxypeptidase-like regulatory domain-containing protein [Mucilaginibacter sp.]
MSKHEADILLIRKYLNGELDARAMHQLEARAQDDPFLMDALEGYESSGRDQQNNLTDLSGRLQQRVERKERRIIPFRWLAIAASVLVVFTIGWLWLSNRPKQSVIPVAKLEKPPVKTPPVQPLAKDTTSARQLAENIPAPAAPRRITTVRPAGAAAPASPEIIAAERNDVLKEARINKDAAAEKDTTPLNEMVVMDYSSKKKAAPIDTGSAGYFANYTNKPAATTDQVLKSQALGVSKTTAISPFSSAQQRPIILQGRVIDNNDKSPLPGASVKVNGKNYGALTDNNGKFRIKVDSPKSKVEIGFVGYNTVKVDAQKSDSLKTIALEPNNSALAEVVVMNSNQATLNARPSDGWVSFNKYLKENATSPDGKKGMVKLSFMVAADGGISEVKVTRGLSTAADKKAIDLINNGPKWNGNSNGKPQLVKLNVRFGDRD